MARRQRAQRIQDERRAKAERAREMQDRLGKPCTRDTPRCPAGKSLRTDMPPCCRGHLIALMDHVDVVFTSLALRWWMDYGTLLGVCQNPHPQRGEGGPIPPGIIPFDKDADIGMFGVDFLTLVDGLGTWTDAARTRPGGSTDPRARTIIVDGFEWTWKLPRRGPIDDRGIPTEEPIAGRWLFSAGHSIKVRYSPVNHINVDIFPWYRHEAHAAVPNDGRYHRLRYIGADQKKGRGLAPERLLPLTDMPWEDRLFPAPAEAEAVCRYRYGPEWYIAKRGPGVFGMPLR